MLKEFKEFAMKGNMVDLAVGVIIGGAFGGLVASMVDDILMPIIAGLFGAPDFSNLFYQFGDVAPAATLAAAKEAGPVFAYGNFITLLINFLIIAWVLFLVIKGINSMKKAEEAAPAAPTKDQELLAEIRDALKKRK